MPLNYMLGLTRMRVRDFYPAGIAMLPGIALRVFLGSTLSNVTSESTSLSELLKGENKVFIIIMVILGIIVGTVAAVWVLRVTKGYIQ
jgi:uncharacterized membrane protein YdjX (TVP38/TMEM64 family)